MKSKTNTFQLALAGMLIAIGIVIPMFSPIKIIIEPASFTLASHVPVFIAMFISPMMAAAVALGTTLGFLLGGFPLTVVLRALTHVIFATIGAWYLQKHNCEPVRTIRSSLGFSFLIGLLHAVCEVDTYLARLLGPSFRLTHRSFEMDDMTIAFDEATQCYSIPITGSVGYYRAEVTDLFKQDGLLHVTVGYIPMNTTGDLIGAQSDTPTKYMDYLFERTGGSWYLTGLTESATKPEQAASSQANSVVMMDSDELQEAILQGVNPDAVAGSEASSGEASSSEAASSEASSGEAPSGDAASGGAASSEAAASTAG